MLTPKQNLAALCRAKVKKLPHVVMRLRSPREEGQTERKTSGKTLAYGCQNLHLLPHLNSYWTQTSLLCVNSWKGKIAKLLPFIFQTFCFKCQERLGDRSVLTFWEWNIPIFYKPIVNVTVIFVLVYKIYYTCNWKYVHNHIQADHIPMKNIDKENTQYWFGERAAVRKTINIRIGYSQCSQDGY